MKPKIEGSRTVQRTSDAMGTTENFTPDKIATATLRRSPYLNGDGRVRKKCTKDGEKAVNKGPVSSRAGASLFNDRSPYQIARVELLRMLCFHRCQMPTMSYKIERKEICIIREVTI